MISESISNYINNRYPRWMDYAEYHVKLAGIPDETGDILNEVLVSLLKKDPDHLVALLQKKKQGYTELDFFILRMIKLNAYSMTSPYRHKTKDVPKDKNKDPWTMEIEDEQEDQVDRNAETLQLWRKARDIYEDLDLPDREKEIFSWRFFADNSLRSWLGPESYPTVCNTFNRIMSIMRENRDLDLHQLKVRRVARAIVQVRPSFEYRYKVQKFARILSRISCGQVV